METISIQDKLRHIKKNPKIRSKKFTGVYYQNIVTNGRADKCFFFTFKDKNDLSTSGKPKLKWVKVGKESNGINLEITNRERNSQISKMNSGKDITLVANKKRKRDILTFQTLADRYFDDKKINKYRVNRYTNHIKSKFGHLDSLNISKKQIKDFLHDLNETYEPATINAIREIITAIFNHSIKEYDLVISNPCTGIPRLKTDNERERYLSSSEIKELLEKLKDNKPIWLTVKLSLSTGARIMSIIDLQKKDLNLNAGTVTIKNFKTGSTYKGFLQKDLIQFLKDYTKKMKMNDYLVSINNGEQPTFKNIQWRLKPLLDELFNKELDSDDRKNRVVIHTFRHTFASHLAINGTPIFTIQKLMDHAKIEQTLRYAKLAPDSGKQNVENLYDL